MEGLTLNDAQDLLKRRGSRGAGILSTLGKQSKLIQALETELGRTLLEDAVTKMDLLLLKIIDEESDEKDRAEYRVLRSITERWATKVVAYYTNLNKVKGGK